MNRIDMKKTVNTVRAAGYVAPQCDILALEGGQMMDPGSGNLPTLEVATEEEW